jgi:hypothetical protein
MSLLGIARIYITKAEENSLPINYNPSKYTNKIIMFTP